MANYHPADRQYHSEKSSESCDKSSILLYRELHHTQRKAAFLEAKPCCVNHRGGSNSSYSTNFIDHGSFRRNDHPANGACSTFRILKICNFQCRHVRNLTYANCVPSVSFLQSTVLFLLALFSFAPVTCSCLVSLLYSMYLFMAYEESGVHHAQEFENRFWTIFALLLSTALFFARDSPLAFGLWSPTLGFIGVLISGYAMHLWDRYLHRLAISQQIRNLGMRRSTTANSSLMRLKDLGIPVEDQLARINTCLQDIDQLLIPSTINNFINQRFIFTKEQEIISVFEECDARALNYLVSHVKLGLLFYKIKDHRSFNGKHRTALVTLLAVERLPILTIVSRVIVLHSLQLLKLRANPKAEFWVRNILLNTHQDNLSELKTLTDTKGDYFCMNKLIYDDIRSETTRQDILNHIRREAAVQQTHIQMGTRRLTKYRMHGQFRKVLSDVDDTLYCSGGMYPAGVDKRYPKKAVYPGVLAFYRELDLGTQGPEEWQDEHVGNLVFLSARPHVYKDMSEKANFAKFEKLRAQGADGRKGMHTVPSLLAGDLASGTSYMVTNDFEPLAQKKFDNFRRYVSIYPEYQHVFVCDNGQGDVRAGELMFDSFPYEFQSLYVHVVMPIEKTHGYSPQRWRQKEFMPHFFRTYPEAALHAASRNPPLIRLGGLQRICRDAVKDFEQITNWSTEAMKAERRLELNQAVWRANSFLEWHYLDQVELIKAECRWTLGQRVRTPYGIGIILDFDPVFDLYGVELDWRPLDIQVIEHLKNPSSSIIRPKEIATSSGLGAKRSLSTVVEMESEEADDEATLQISVGLHLPKRQEVGEPSAERPITDRQRSDRSRISTRKALGTNVLSENGNVQQQRREVESSIPNDFQRLNQETKAKAISVKARIGGRFISKLTPPVLPKIDKEKGRSIFTFLAPVQGSVPLAFKEGDECTTPFGPARVAQYRSKNEIVVVDFIGWYAVGYLAQQDVKVIPKSLLRSLFRQMSASEGSQRPVDYSSSDGTVIATPFGLGSVVRPVAPPGRDTKRAVSPTVRIRLESWTLANGNHPELYCTVENAEEWKKSKSDETKSIFSALENLVTSSRTLFEPFLSNKTPTKIEPKFEQYYKDSASVTTIFGEGVVHRFRSIDGFYEVHLTRWMLASNKCATAFLRRESINYRIANGCKEGYPVLTTLGASGTLASVDPTTGVHIVTVPTAGMICYLQPDHIARSLKAAVGENVLTAFGEGKIETYSLQNDTYTIILAGWRGKLFAKEVSFERVGDGVQDRDGPFGVNWLLRFLFFSSARGPRSRSNSLIGGSQSSRSVTNVD